MSDNIISLASHRPAGSDAMYFLACEECDNKTFLFLVGDDDRPVVTCAACEARIGYVMDWCGAEE